MTLVNHETGEVVECMTSDQARRLTVEAQNEFISAADHFEKGWAKVEEAVRGGGYLALGYNSPGHYLHAEFDGVLAGIDPADRRVAVRSMAEWGLSSRAIAPVVGVTDRQARRDISGGTSVPPAQTPEPAESGESDAGSGQAPEGEVAPSSGNNEVEAAETPAPRPPVVGIDGKAYPRPAPVDHAARAAEAVREFPELAFYADRGEAEHAWRLAARLRSYPIAERLERLNTLRRSIEVDRQPSPQPIRASTCPTCGQTVKD